MLHALASSAVALFMQRSVACRCEAIHPLGTWATSNSEARMLKSTTTGLLSGELCQLAPHIASDMAGEFGRCLPVTCCYLLRPLFLPPPMTGLFLHVYCSLT